MIYLLKPMRLKVLTMTKIYCCAGGHSAKAPGASHFIDEYTEDRRVVAALITELENRGYSVVNASNEEPTQSRELAAEVNTANASGAGLFCAIHFNAESITDGVRGSECWYYTGSSAKSLAVKVAQNVSSVLGLPCRGAKASTSLYVLRHTSMPSILVEVCFVDAKGDVNAYQNKGVNAVAAAIADAIAGTSYGITNNVAPAAPSVSITYANGNIAEVQRWCNSNYNYSQEADGINGPNTKKGLVIAYQTELNKQFGAGLSVDGIFGSKTKAATVNVRYGAQGNITRVLQGALICLGYSTNGFDGLFYGGTQGAVKAYQRAKGLSVDGIAGKNTFAGLLS